MRTFGLNGQFNAVVKHHPPAELTAAEWDRLRALTVCQPTQNVALACRTFGVSRATLYRSRQRFNPQDLTSRKGALPPPEAPASAAVGGAGGDPSRAARADPVPAPGQG